MIKIIHRYLLKEIALPFLLILMILTFVLLMGKTLRLMDLMVNKGVSVIDILQLIAFLMPSLLVYTIPISLLIAILIGVGRLSNDNEITVMKSSGVSLYQLFLPVLLFAMTAFLTTAAMSFFLLPIGNTATKNLLFSITQQKASVGIQEKVFNDDFQGLLIYADHIPQSGDYLEGVLICDRRSGQEPATIFARRAYLISDPHNLALSLRLESGISANVDLRRATYRHILFNTYDINLDLSTPTAGAKRKDSREMTFRELMKELGKKGLEQKKAGELMTELYRKIIVPFSCLIFAIIGLPLAIRPQRSPKARGFVVGLGIILTYYLLQLGSDALVEMGKLPPIIGAGGTTLLFLIAGITLFIVSAQETGMHLYSRHQRKN
ncbi:MAG: LPS export ABC transporter permease LptF [Syntrophaceae bacterium]|nr:LPS export ABC transporter permease LptF [Syntrophaceae bacterium]